MKMNKDLKHTIVMLTLLILLTVFSFGWGYMVSKDHYTQIPSSGNHYKVVRLDEQTGEVLLRSSIQYITTDENDNLIILN